jgi:hypothetical protein
VRITTRLLVLGAVLTSACGSQPDALADLVEPGLIGTLFENDTSSSVSVFVIDGGATPFGCLDLPGVTAWLNDKSMASFGGDRGGAPCPAPGYGADIGPGDLASPAAIQVRDASLTIDMPLWERVPPVRARLIEPADGVVVAGRRVVFEWPGATQGHEFAVSFAPYVQVATADGQLVTAVFRPATTTVFGPATLELRVTGPREPAPCDGAACTWQHRWNLAFPVELRDSMAGHWR